MNKAIAIYLARGGDGEVQLSFIIDHIRIDFIEFATLKDFEGTLNKMQQWVCLQKEKTPIPSVFEQAWDNEEKEWV